jgi:HD-GYP domain-containing protein (c-di-GMP phosphodiesterase class II)
MALVDAYSAMILDRPYRKAMSRAQAIAELERNAGTQFDPELVGMFVAILRDEETEAA